MDGIKTLDDVKLDGKTILVRLDLNSPLDPKTMEFLDDRRFLSHKETLQELFKHKVKLIILAHQGRPGEADFTTMEEHAKKLSKVVGHEIKYVDSLISNYVMKEIKAMKAGDAIMLENTRMYSEEVLKRPADVQAETILVKKLSKAADLFINDGFAVCHRSQPSVVGFPKLLPSAAGRLVEKEVKTLMSLLAEPKKPVTFVLGGTKADDSIRVATRALENGVDRILAGGVVGNIFLAAKGYRIGEPNIEFIRGKRMIEQIDIARELLLVYKEKIVLPRDVATDEHGKRVEIPVGQLPTKFQIADVGSKTIEEFTKLISESGTIFMNGAIGIFEKKAFAKGTNEIIKAIADSKGFSVIGGGHTVAAAHELKLGSKINHVSSGGGACVNMLAGYELPGIEVLKGGK